jgi:head-tail adaptor
MTIRAGARRHLVTLENPGTRTPDGDGGWTDVFAALNPPALYAEIKPATARDLERLAAGTVLSTESLLVMLPFHPDVTTKTRLTWIDPAGRAHAANVTGVNNPDQRCIDLILVAVEVVQ